MANPRHLDRDLPAPGQRDNNTLLSLMPPSLWWFVMADCQRKCVYATNLYSFYC